jgi:hypothetical protein
MKTIFLKLTTDPESEKVVEGTKYRLLWEVCAILEYVSWVQVNVKVILQQAEVVQGVLGRLRPQIFLTFSTTRVAGHHPYAPAAFTPGEIPGTHFQRLG